jgi:hypothetical protein
MTGYADPRALEAAITQRLRNRFGPGELARRRSEVAYRRLVARLAVQAPGRWVVKGGYGLILRLDPNRMSNDVDVVYLDEAADHAVALRALEAACATDLGDFFAFAITRVDAADATRARAVTIIATLGTREWSRFQVDLAIPRPSIDADPLDHAPALTGIALVDAIPPGLAALAWPQQIAEKVCGLFERHGTAPSGRVRDLIDLAMIARQVDSIDANALIDALRQEAARRPLLPDGLPLTAELAADQRAQSVAATRRATRAAPIGMNDAESAVRRFIDPVLNGSAAAHHWSAARQAWTRVPDAHPLGGNPIVTAMNHRGSS